MAEPITPVDHLEKNMDDMKTQMELLIMRIQAEFCRALEEEEDKVRSIKYIILLKPFYFLPTYFLPFFL